MRFRMAKIIEVRNLIFDYVRIDDETGDTLSFRAIDDVSFDVEAGSFVAVLGMNGSGKSTLAKCLNGLLLPTSGDVLVNGMNTQDGEHIWDIRSTVGMVFQNPDNQIVSSVVEDDVAFGPENLGVPPSKIRDRVDNALLEVGMSEYRFKSPHMLSGGQKQRVAIAGVVAMRPKCIVFDEPTAMLDPRGRNQIMKVIKKLNKDGKACVLITHFMDEAAQADRIITMKDGRIYSDTTPAELFSNRELIKGAGLDMPIAVQIREALAERGIDVPTDIIDGEALAKYIRKLKDEGWR